MPASVNGGAPNPAVPDEVDDVELLRRFPTASIDHDNVEFYRGLLRRQLLVDRCIDCDLLFFPPRSLCPECWGTRIAATQVSGKGTVFLATTSRPADGGVQSGRQAAPSEGADVLVAVALVEQPDVRISAPLVQCTLDEVALGMEVEVTWLDHDGQPYPAFRPAR